VEKLIGKDPSSLLSLPKPGDAAGWGEFYAKVGRPETADKYDLKFGAESMQVDAGFQTKIADMFHKAGLSAEQAKGIAGDYNAMLKAQTAQEGKDYELNVAADKQSLLSKWGGGYERHMNAAQLGVAALGFDSKVVSAIESALGYGGTMELFAGLGMKFSEDKFVSGGGAPKFSGVMSPQEAAAEIDKFKQDTAFQATLRDKFNPSHKANLKKWQDMFAVAYPG
jgi:hypothetical protein